MSNQDFQQSRHTAVWKPHMPNTQYQTSMHPSRSLTGCKRISRLGNLINPQRMSWVSFKPPFMHESHCGVQEAALVYYAILICRSVSSLKNPQNWVQPRVQILLRYKKTWEIWILSSGSVVCCVSPCWICLKIVNCVHLLVVSESSWWWMYDQRIGAETRECCSSQQL